jgi:hypothetical protein
VWVTAAVSNLGNILLSLWEIVLGNTYPMIGRIDRSRGVGTSAGSGFLVTIAIVTLAGMEVRSAIA